MIDDEIVLCIKGICGSNPGAISFFIEAMKENDLLAVQGFRRMVQNNIKEDKLYMLWNDCCDRNTKEAIYIMSKKPIDEIIEHINYENGRGIPFKY